MKPSGQSSPILTLTSLSDSSKPPKPSYAEMAAKPPPAHTGVTHPSALQHVGGKMRQTLVFSKTTGNVYSAPKDVQPSSANQGSSSSQSITKNSLQENPSHRPELSPLQIQQEELGKLKHLLGEPEIADKKLSVEEMPIGELDKLIEDVKNSKLENPTLGNVVEALNGLKRYKSPGLYHMTTRKYVDGLTEYLRRASRHVELQQSKSELADWNADLTKKNMALEKKVQMLENQNALLQEKSSTIIAIGDNRGVKISNQEKDNNNLQRENAILKEYIKKTIAEFGENVPFMMLQVGINSLRTELFLEEKAAGHDVDEDLQQLKVERDVIQKKMEVMIEKARSEQK